MIKRVAMNAPGVNCVKANEFLRRVDAYLAMQRNKDVVSCTSLLLRLRAERDAAKSRALATRRYVLADLIESAYMMVVDEVECRGDTAINVGHLRVFVDRIRCTPASAYSSILGTEVKTTQLILAKAPQTTRPIPPGFVKPRVLPQGWTARGALADGWVRHAVHDWLQPVDTVRDTPLPETKAPLITPVAPTAVATLAPTPTTLAPTPAPTPAPTSAPVTTPAPAPVTEAPAAAAAASTAAAASSGGIGVWTWVGLGVGGAVLLTLLLWWLRRWIKRRRGTSGGYGDSGGYQFDTADGGDTQLESAFANVSPPSPDTASVASVDTASAPSNVAAEYSEPPAAAPRRRGRSA